MRRATTLCGKTQQGLLSAGQVQERLNGAGYSPLMMNGYNLIITIDTLA